MIYITKVSQVRESDLRLLSDYRRKKAVSKKRSRDRLQSIAASLLLSYAVNQYGLSERDMEYGEGGHGKPYFKNCPKIKFSLSHSGDFAVCAVSENETGVDIEAEEGNADILKIAERYFTENEYARVKNRSDGKDEFFRLWTRKESILKAIGTGISAGLGSYEVLTDIAEFSLRKWYFSDFEFDGAKIACCTENEKESDIRFVCRDELTE